MLSPGKEESLTSNENFERLIETFLAAGEDRKALVHESENLPFPIPIPRLFSPISLSPTPTEAEALMLFKSVIDIVKIFYDVNVNRDQHVVRSVLNQPGNGLIIFGASHGPGIKEGLTTACQKWFITVNPGKIKKLQ